MHMNKSNVIAFRKRESPPSRPPPDDYDAANAIRKCESMLHLLSQNHGEASEAFFTFLMINLSDLAQRASTMNRRVTFSEDVFQVQEVKDVTDLITKLRNAVCHIRSPIRKIGDGIFTFNRFQGFLPNAMLMNDVRYGCDYADDVALYYGSHRIYLRRHCQRAINELKVIFQTPL